MADRSTREDLPLLSRTPEDWAAAVLREPLALLSDHAYLEKKAASNALELLNRWPGPTPPDDWTQTLAAIASDEANHLGSVVRLLNDRGGRLDRSHRNDYARELRRHVRQGRGPDDLLDRLLVSALIELRSCERFEVLARYCEGPGTAEGDGRDPALGRLYRRLWSSEFGHYRVFLRLAEHVAPRSRSRPAGARCSASRPTRSSPSPLAPACTAAGRPRPPAILGLRMSSLNAATRHAGRSVVRERNAWVAYGREIRSLPTADPVRPDLIGPIRPGRSD